MKHACDCPFLIEEPCCFSSIFPLIMYIYHVYLLVGEELLPKATDDERIIVSVEGIAGAGPVIF
jgi:hypothetical protein